jgi:hypothetical protein
VCHLFMSLNCVFSVYIFKKLNVTCAALAAAAAAAKRDRLRRGLEYCTTQRRDVIS